MVHTLYQLQNPERDRWADHMYKEHIFDVAERAEDLALRFGARIDVCRAAAVMHDIADAVVDRSNPAFGRISMELATRMLAEADFGTKESADILEDALPFHSCKKGRLPTTKVGKILATADALSHLLTNHYAFFNSAFKDERTSEEAKSIARARITRDFHDKILFPEIKDEVRDNYKELLTAFG